MQKILAQILTLTFNADRKPLIFPIPILIPVLYFRVFQVYPLRVYRNIYITIYIVVSFYTLPYVCFRIIGSFSCIQVDPNQESQSSQGPAGLWYGSTLRLLSDYSIDCESAEYYACRFYAAILAVLYFAVVPGTYFYFLYQHRELIAKRNNPDTTTTGGIVMKARRESLVIDSNNFLNAISFLYLSYKPKYWFFEIVDIARRLFFTCILGVMFSDPSSQLSTGIVVSAIFYAFYFRMQPYDSPGENLLSDMGNFQLVITFIIMAAVRSRSFDDLKYSYILNSEVVTNTDAYQGLDIALLAINLVAIVQAIVLLLREVFESRKAVLQSKNKITNGKTPKKKYDTEHPRIFPLSAEEPDSYNLQPPKENLKAIIITQIKRFAVSDVDKLCEYLLSNSSDPNTKDLLAAVCSELRKRRPHLPGLSIGLLYRISFKILLPFHFNIFLSYPILSYPILSYLILSYLI